PSLTAADDAVGFDRPWNPWSLVMLVFFAGPLFGGVLAARNFVRLGQPERSAPAIGLFVAIWLAILGVQLASTFDRLDERQAGRTVPVQVSRIELPDRDGAGETVGLGGGAGGRMRDHDADADASRIRRLAYRVAGLIPAFFVARAQRRRFRVFEGAGGEPAPLLKLGILLVVAS